MSRVLFKCLPAEFECGLEMLICALLQTKAYVCISNIAVIMEATLRLKFSRFLIMKDAFFVVFHDKCYSGNQLV